jgi:hypothetical protein
MVSSTMLTLIVIPAIYALIKGWRLRSSDVAATSNRASVTEPAGLGVAAE